MGCRATLQKKEIIAGLRKNVVFQDYFLKLPIGITSNIDADWAKTGVDVLSAWFRLTHSTKASLTSRLKLFRLFQFLH